MKITLIRHGKPTTANNPVVSAHEYTQWVRRYNNSTIAENSRPEFIDADICKAHIISSDLKRAIISSAIYTGEMPVNTYPLFREMEIPRYKLPFRMKALTWLYLSRLLWVLEFKGRFESFKQAKIRADLAAAKLIELANQQGEVVLFSHGYINVYIRKALIRKGWELKTKSNKYWGVTHLES